MPRKGHVLYKFVTIGDMLSMVAIGRLALIPKMLKGLGIAKKTAVVETDYINSVNSPNIYFNISGCQKGILDIGELIA